MRVDLNVNHALVVASLADDTADISVFFKHIHGLVEVLSVLEQRTSAKVMQVILPYLPDVFGAYLAKNLLSLDSSDIHIAQAVSIDSLLSEIFSYLNSVAERVERYPCFNRISIVQSTFHTMDNTAQAENQTVILTAPILTESHICEQ